MKVKFIGAIERVTGSCTLLENPETGLRFLVDCGMAQGDPNALAINQTPWPFLAWRIDFVLLTHAHLDHCGLLPRLVREGFSGLIYCTRFTADIARQSLFSAAMLPGASFTRMDVELLQFEHVDDWSSFECGKPVSIAKGLFASFQPSAHIGGACSITIRWNTGDASWKEMAFSGDLGPNTEERASQPLLAGREYLRGAPQYLLVESTYGGRLRESEFSNADRRHEEWVSSSTLPSMWWRTLITKPRLKTTLMRRTGSWPWRKSFSRPSAWSADGSLTCTSSTRRTRISSAHSTPVFPG